MIFKKKMSETVGILSSDAGRWKTLGVPVVIGGDNLPFPIGIGLTNLPNIRGASGPPAPPPVPAPLLRVDTSRSALDQ